MDEHMNTLWEVVRWLWPDVFVQKYYDNSNEAENELVQFGRSKVQELDQPLKKFYKRSELSGSGAYGNTYIARDLSSKKEVVIKMLSNEKESDKRHNMCEIAVLSSCNHPNIVSFFYAYSIKDTKKNLEEMAIIMEYLQGGTLKEAASASSLTEKHIAFIAREVISAINYLHSNQWVHRELKSSNGMIDINGSIKLIDFGLCASMKDGPKNGILGTPYWIPPEMILQQTHGYPADVWSMGVCVLEMFIGRPPHAPSSLRCMFKAATAGHEELFPKTASDDARDFLHRVLDINQNSRATAADLLKHKWLTQKGLEEGLKTALDTIFLNKQLQSFMPY